MNRWFVAVGATCERVYLNRSHSPVWNSSLLCGFAGADFLSSQIWSRFEGRRRTRSFSGKHWKFKKHNFTQGHFADSQVVFLKELVLALRTGKVRIRAFWVRGIWTSVAIMRGADKLDAGAFSPVFVAFMREDVAQERSTTDPEDGALVPKQQTRKDCSWGVRLGGRPWMVSEPWWWIWPMGCLQKFLCARRSIYHSLLWGPAGENSPWHSGS